MRACPLTTTAVSSTKTQSGSCSSGGSSTTSSPNRRRVLTYSECCCFAFSRLITPFVPTAFFSKESGKRQTTAWVNLKALAMFYCFFPLSTRLLFCATGGLRGRQHTHTHTHYCVRELSNNHGVHKKCCNRFRQPRNYSLAASVYFSK